jgi:hypothetical protein
MLFINDADELGIILYAPVIATKVSFWKRYTKS